VNQFANIKGLHVQFCLPRLNLADIDDIVDELQQVSGALFDHAQLFFLNGGQLSRHAHQENPREAEDGIERRPQFMAHRGDEHRLEMIQLLKPAIGFGQFGGPLPDPLFQFLIGADVSHRNGRRVRQRLHQQQFVAAGAVRLRPVNTDGAVRIRGMDGNDGQAFDECWPIQILGNPIILKNIFDDHRLAMQHRPTADAALQREAAPLPQGSHGVLIHVKTVALVAQDERGPIGADQLPSSRADGFGNLFHR